MSCFRGIIVCYLPRKKVVDSLPPSRNPSSVHKPKITIVSSTPTTPKGPYIHTLNRVPFIARSSTSKSIPTPMKTNSFTNGRTESAKWAPATPTPRFHPINDNNNSAGCKPLRRVVSSNGFKLDKVSAEAGFAHSRTMSSKRGDYLGGVGSNSVKLQRSSTFGIRSGGGGQHPPIIMFSSSSGHLKPSQVELRLLCSLDELCFGCVKQIRVWRDIVTSSGQISQEEELLTVNVEPGWTKGTKITFPGGNNNNNVDKEEDSGGYSSDVVFVVAEKDHRLLKRIRNDDNSEDDLEVEVTLPLVDAITGCDVPIPLLGGEKMSLSIDEVITPGFVKVIKGQGMPCRNEPSKRGDLRVKFNVEFPKVLTRSQREEIFEILS